MYIKHELHTVRFIFEREKTNMLKVHCFKFIKHLKAQVKKRLPCLFAHSGEPNEQRAAHPSSLDFYGGSQKQNVNMTDGIS